MAGIGILSKVTWFMAFKRWKYRPLGSSPHCCLCLNFPSGFLTLSWPTFNPLNSWHVELFSNILQKNLNWNPVKASNSTDPSSACQMLGICATEVWPNTSSKTTIWYPLRLNIRCILHFATASLWVPMVHTSAIYFEQAIFNFRNNVRKPTDVSKQVPMSLSHRHLPILIFIRTQTHSTPSTKRSTFRKLERYLSRRHHCVTSVLANETGVVSQHKTWALI